MCSNNLWQLNIFNERDTLVTSCYKYSSQYVVADASPKDILRMDFSVGVLLVSFLPLRYFFPFFEKFLHQTSFPYFKSVLILCTTQHLIYQTLSLTPIHSFLDNFRGLCSQLFPHLFLPMSVPPWMSHSVVQEEVGVSWFPVFTQVQRCFSSPEGLLTALGLLPMWPSLLSLFPGSHYVHHLASFHMVFCCPSWLVSIFWRARGDFSTHCTLFSHCLFPLLGSLKLLLLKYLSYWTLSSFSLISKLTLSTVLCCTFLSSSSYSVELRCWKSCD